MIRKTKVSSPPCYCLILRVCSHLQGSREVMRPVLLIPHPAGQGGRERLVPATPPQSSSDFSSLPGPPGCRADSCLMKRFLHLWSGPPGSSSCLGPGFGESSKEVPSSLAPTPKHTPGDPLPHGQPYPTHFRLMRSRLHTRAALTGLTYLIKTAAPKNGGSAPRLCPWPQRQTQAVSGQLGLRHPSQSPTLFSPSLLPAPPFSNICVQKGRKTLFGLASFHLSFFSSFKRLV